MSSANCASWLASACAVRRGARAAVPAELRRWEDREVALRRDCRRAKPTRSAASSAVGEPHVEHVDSASKSWSVSAPKLGARVESVSVEKPRGVSGPEHDDAQ